MSSNLNMENFVSFNMDLWNFPLPSIHKDQDEDRSSTDGDTSSYSVGTSASSGGEEIQSPPKHQARESVKLITSLNKIAESTEDSGEEYKKPAQSYIALISKAILESPDRRLILGDIYSFIMDRFPYYKYTEDTAWKNSIRHNLSLNECFIKNGRADNGKGNYWSIHPACIEDFKKGDFRRRQARRRAKRCQSQPQRPQQQPQSQTHMAGFGTGNGLSSHIQSLPFSYPYNMGYVSMSQMPSGYPSNYGLSQYYPHVQHQSPAGSHAQISSPLMTSSPVAPMSYSPATLSPKDQTSTSSMNPSLPSYSCYLQSHKSNSSTAPPNVNSSQLSQQPTYIPQPLHTSASHLYSGSTHVPTTMDSIFHMGTGFCNNMR